jgi:hypothetical protein
MVRSSFKNCNDPEYQFSITDMEYNFQKAEPGTTETFGVPYNYASVMHYSKFAFSPSGYDETIIPLVNLFKIISIFFVVLDHSENY